MNKPTAVPELMKAAPDFTLPDQDNQLFSLLRLKGKWSVIYFYPKALTSGCTVQACAINKELGTFKAMNVPVIGISPDTPERLMTFAIKEDLAFPLLADTDHTVAALYGVWQQKSMYGRTYWGVARTTFILTPELLVADILHEVNPGMHAEQVLRRLKTLIV